MNSRQAVSAILARSTFSAGVGPDSEAHVHALVDNAMAGPDFMTLAIVAYVVASRSPLLAHRSIGMRLMGIKTVRIAR